MHSMGKIPFETFQQTKDEVDYIMMRDEDYYVLALLVLSGAEEFSQHSKRNETPPLDIANGCNSNPKSGQVSQPEEESH